MKRKKIMLDDTDFAEFFLSLHREQKMRIALFGRVWKLMSLGRLRSCHGTSYVLIGGIAFMVIAALLITAGARNAVTSTSKAATQARELPPELARSQGQTHVVRPGESLWTIAERTYGRGTQWMALWAVNHEEVRNPDRIRPGLRLKIPPADWSPPRLPKRRAPSGYEYWKTIRATVTAYEPSWRSCGQFADGKTSVGRNAWRIDGCATDPRAIPYGSLAYVPGVGFRRVDDTGSALRRSWSRGIYHVDVRMKYYYQARRWGKRRLSVKLYRRIS